MSSKRLSKSLEQPFEADQVIEAYAAFSGIGRNILVGPTRAEAVVWPRHVLAWLLRELTHLSWVRIGHILGGRDQATVRHSTNKVETRRADDIAFAERVMRAYDFVTNYSPETRGSASIERARKLIASASNEEVRDLAMSVLMATSMLASRELSDAEARAAALQIIGGRTDG